MPIRKIPEVTPQLRPTPQDEKFMEYGFGHDTHDTEAQSPRRDPAPTARFTVVCPVDLHRRFKSKCGRDGTTMGAEIVAMIEAWVDD